MEQRNVDQIKSRIEKLDSVLKKIETSSTNNPPAELMIKDTLDLQLLKNNGKRSFTALIQDLEQSNLQSIKTTRLKGSQEALDPLIAVERKKARILENLNVPLNEHFKSKLKYHQLEGVEFLWRRVYEKKGGCLLSHAMGLGKSIQTIALLNTLYENLDRNPEVAYPTGKRVLILAPLITLSNWTNEFRKWHVEGFTTVLGQVFNFGDIAATRRESRIKYLQYWYTNGGVMLMNYDQLRYLIVNSSKSEDEYYKYLINPGPDVVVLDEGHRIRNAGSQISQIISEFRTRARICLTGYPLQNHLLEYYYMLDFVAPGILGPKETFKSYFTFYIEKSYADSSKSIRQKAASRLYTLQLLTEEVAHRRDATTLQKDLPFKTEYVVSFKMTDVQRLGYINALKSIEHQGSLIDHLFILRTICNHPKILQKLLIKRKSKRREQFYVNAMNDDKDDDYVDQGSDDESNCDPSLASDPVDVDTEKGNDIDDLYDEETEIAKWDDDSFQWAIDYFKNDDVESWKCSNKISFIVDLAFDCNAIKEKLIIVSHSLACHDYLQHLFSVIGIEASRIDGGTSPNLRQPIIDDFNSDQNKLIMLLSAKAAAIGINVTSANRIVLIDQDWNPLYDEQSIGRIYRYGQLKPVVVYRLITSSTIEERIFAQSLHKKSISRRLIDNKLSATISKDELKEYYIHPPPDLPLANMNDIRKNVKPDIVTYSALYQNKDYITECKLHDLETVDEYDPTTRLSKAQQKEALVEATEFLKKWRLNNMRSFSRDT
ncbi:hypothetical protein G6F29_008392 [Rhizopus arrhizus]|nr:hypothetical protein G6F24_005457 [Rhizopus arrhizus]KAG0810501.1 hypothetical protein G6F20_007911 [Rhizopus arrhizus]KAG0844087.1 hypothetical protein G6F19_000064 [Rhizopus arrhizus]KAG0894136.1 hypothetical protein G6F34_009362 [Rhizopus arrhizus]KAG0979689.1 hypothetical protein G6F29_008392 [Rhizopus arrhizus]